MRYIHTMQFYLAMKTKTIYTLNLDKSPENYAEREKPIPKTGT